MIEQAFSSVPYERGSQFLFFLEHTVLHAAFAFIVSVLIRLWQVGGPDVFEPFIRQWVKEVLIRFGEQSMKAEEIAWF